MGYHQRAPDDNSDLRDVHITATSDIIYQHPFQIPFNFPLYLGNSYSTSFFPFTTNTFTNSSILVFPIYFHKLHTCFISITIIPLLYSPPETSPLPNQCPYTIFSPLPLSLYHHDHNPQHSYRLHHLHLNHCLPKTFTSNHPPFCLLFYCLQHHHCLYHQQH